MIDIQIASFEKATFDFCECVDKSTGQELRHPKGECVVDGLVIVKIIYTAEEADRRKAEERELNEVLMRSRVQVGYHAHWICLQAMEMAETGADTDADPLE